MSTTPCSRVWFRIGFAGFLLVAGVQPNNAFTAQDDDAPRPSGATRLKFLQQVLRDMQVESTLEDGEDRRELKFQMTPLLRYNDPERGIADSVIFRLGTRGRPIAIVTAELYDGSGRQFLLNHEFLAIDDARIRLRRDVFRWQPPKGAGLRFQPIDSETAAANNPRARLAQFKSLAARFSAREEWAGEQTKLRLLPTPLDRYVPSDSPNSDGVVFAFVAGVNPEALLFLETDGMKFSFAWARLGAAQLESRLDDRTVWGVSGATEHEHPTAGYTSIHRTAYVPVELETNDEEEGKQP
ncbi:MAG TPA: hypothetical protein VKU82_09030 [Planctomycetaceae bacterium]|nr:hypothetical protein [Planctomycetaceae bacterium]